VPTGYDLASYSSALIDVALSRIPRETTVPRSQKQPSYQGSITEHLELLNLARKSLQRLILEPQIQQNSSPILFHPDLHKRNIFVSEDDPTVITAVIDWQSTSIQPAFYYADDVPDFAKPSSLPDTETETEPNSTAEDLCSQAFDAGLQLLAPRLAAARKVDETLLRPFRFCHRTWKDGIVPLTQELMELRGHWHEESGLGFEASPAWIEARHERLKVYEGMLSVRQDIIDVLGCEGDGWVPTDRWREAEDAHRKVYEYVMSAMDDEGDREDMRIMWPFDGVKSI
jgi:hypothetical protein